MASELGSCPKDASYDNDDAPDPELDAAIEENERHIAEQRSIIEQLQRRILEVERRLEHR